MKASVTIPDNLYKQAKSLTGNFSLLVTKALQEYIRMQRVEKARESFGKWEHREGKSNNIVNEIRADKGRVYADRTH